MTVKELIEKLEKMDKDSEVWVSSYDYAMCSWNDDKAEKIN